MERTIKAWIEKFNNGDFNSSDISVQCDAGWFDWFCKDTSLKNKTISMGRIIKKLVNSEKINIDTMYVWFKNSCPVCHPLYDCFKISDIETQDVIFCININCGYEKSTYAVYGKSNDFKEPLFGCETKKELINWFNQ